MRSRTVQLPAGPCPGEILRAAASDEGRPPDLALGFLPPDDRLPATLAALAAAWPESLRLGCEAAAQLAGTERTGDGTLQLFWLDDPRHRPRVARIEGSLDRPPTGDQMAAFAARLADADGALLLADGLRFPVEPLLDGLRRRLGAAGPGPPAIAGGLALEGDGSDPGESSHLATASGARVFLGEEILAAACLAALFRGITMRVEVLRGWEAASPVYTVTRAAGNVLYEVDGEPATAWYARFFDVGGALAPLPASACRFPLIVESPASRQSRERSMRCFDRPRGAVSFWGSLCEGERVRLGMSRGAGGARPPARPADGDAGRRDRGLPPEAAILWSGIGRERALGRAAGDELAAIHRSLHGAALSGCLTRGEIGPGGRGDPTPELGPRGLALHNQAAILVLLNEAPG